MVLPLWLEVAPGGAVARVPSLPGCTFRAGDAEQLLRVAPGRVAEYAEWCMDEGIGDLDAELRRVVRLIEEGRRHDIRVTPVGREEGAPIWLSGQPAALLSSDRRPLTDAEVRAHFRFLRAVARRIRLQVAGLTPTQRAWKPAPDRRSIDETLRHVARCIWWTCSRIDDDLPGPPPFTEKNAALHFEPWLDAAEEHVLAYPAESRSRTIVPERYPTADPSEPWTHAKVVRRQAEHMWEHLAGIARAVRAAAEA